MKSLKDGLNRQISMTYWRYILALMGVGFIPAGTFGALANAPGFSNHSLAGGIAMIAIGVISLICAGITLKKFTKPTIAKV